MTKFRPKLVNIKIFDKHEGVFPSLHVYIHNYKSVLHLNIIRLFQDLPVQELEKLKTGKLVSYF